MIRLTVDGTPLTLHGKVAVLRWAKVHGLTLGSHVFVAAPLRTVSAMLLAHELRHVQQYAALGWARFLWRYAREWWQHGYGPAMPLEADAMAYAAARHADPDVQAAVRLLEAT
jgi:hypothetical protein